MENNYKKKLIKSGIIGWPLEHSFSPEIHNYWFKQFGLNYSYKKIPIKSEELNEYFTNLRKSNLVGINVTVPFKEKVLSLVDIVDDTAKKIGAINISSCCKQVLLNIGSSSIPYLV